MPSKLSKKPKSREPRNNKKTKPSWLKRRTARTKKAVDEAVKRVNRYTSKKGGGES